MAAAELRLIACLALALAAAPGGLRAEGEPSEVTAQVDRYSGTDGVSIYSPALGYATDLDSRSRLALHFQVDAVSAASFNYAQSKTHLADPRRVPGNCKLCHLGVDAISGASVNYKDERHELTASVNRRFGDTTVSPSYIVSQEDDYLSQTLALGLSQDLFSRDTTLALSYSYGNSRIDPVWNLAQVSGLVTQVGGVSLTQVLTRYTQARLGAEWTDLEGFLSNPYAFVEVAGNQVRPVMETHPEHRAQQVLSASLRQYLGWDATLELDYRHYEDDWGVVSDTEGVDLAQQLGGLRLHASWRHYAQSAAYFFQNTYTAMQPYVTRDLKLAAFSDDLFELGLEQRLSQHLDMDLSYGRFARYDALDYSLYYADTPVAANLVSLGVNYH